ncbi:MAG: DUF5916 domain-containing protein [Bacteroidales bacterium]
MKTTAVTLLLLLLLLGLTAQNNLPPMAVAVRTNTSPRIDGHITDSAWSGAGTISNFKQYIPVYNVKESFRTEVKILYDNEAVYIAAFMQDPNPDSILRQLGNRDEENLNADYFSVEFDTYNHQLDAYTFTVFASGVQADSRLTDETYDAVWHSAVRIDKQGWTAELKIPYSAIRFPATSIQNWKLQIKRDIRRYRELDLWALTVKEAPNKLVFWGDLQGIEKVDPALRLSLTPYLSATYENYPLGDNGNDPDSYSFSGGMDLKYGLNESFTLDISLLPDFSQVQSDNLVKNLSAFETVYDEQRPFFKEAVDLFDKGDLFYSRRIGRIPMEFYLVENLLHPGEKIKKNPPAAKLLNATKVSGRNKNGLAIGVFNAITGNTYATIEDSSGSTRKVLTDPRSNYNIIVFDQALKNNSSVYLINTNVTRDKGYRNANVTGSGLTWFDRTNTMKFVASGAVSQIYNKIDSLKNEYNTVLGLKYNVSLGKVKGNYQTSVYSSGMDDKFSANDMGVTLYNNTMTHGVQFAMLHFEPKFISRDGNIRFRYESEQNYLTRKPIEEGFYINAYSTLLNYLSLWNEITLETRSGYDYYEPRSPGRHYIKPKYIGFNQGFSSDYRKPFALDGHVAYYYAARDAFDLYELLLSPLVRVNNHLFFTYSFRWFKFFNDMGYAYKTTVNDVIFGKRDVTEIENTFSGRYMFKNNLSLNLRFRHYWSKGIYHEYYLLEENGFLSDAISQQNNSNFNFNAFTIDMVFWWEFAPGSRLNLIWKNAINKEDHIISRDFWDNFKHTWESPQDNSLTIKLLYYLDYLSLKNKKRS